MLRDQPPTPPTYYWPSKRAWAAYVGTLVIGIGCGVWDGGYNTTPDTHPLQTDRLCLRIIGMAAIVANLAIAGTCIFRAYRLAARLRDGLCPACGYDLRVQRENSAGDGRDLCPECGSAVPAHPPAAFAPPRCTVRILKLLAALDHWPVHLAIVLACVLVAVLVHNVFFQLSMVWFALSSLRSIIRRDKRGSLYEQMLR
jgi:hypothetical protein